MENIKIMSEKESRIWLLKCLLSYHECMMRFIGPEEEKRHVGLAIAKAETDLYSSTLEHAIELMEKYDED